MKLSKFLSLGLAHLATIGSTVAQDAPRNIQTVYEIFSLPKSEAAELQRAGHDDAAFYKTIVSATANKKARQEHLLAIRGRPGNTVSARHVSNFISPTEFEPPELPNQVGLFYEVPGTATEEKPGVSIPVTPAITSIFPSTPATPTSFDTYNLGATLEVEPQIDVAGKTVEIRLSATINRLLAQDVWGQGLSEAKVPRISRQAQTSSVTVRSGVPTLVGTFSPAPEAQDKEAGERVWFAFLTTTVIESKK